MPWERVEGLLGCESQAAAHLALPEAEAAFPPGTFREEASGQELELDWG